MSRRWFLGGCGVLLGISGLQAQYPQYSQPTPPQAIPRPLAPSQPQFPQPSRQPVSPALLPPSLRPEAVPLPQPVQPRNPVAPGQQSLPDGSMVPAEVRLPYPEKITQIDVGRAMLRREGGSWQVWMGERVFKDLGNDENTAKDVLRVMRELRATEWVSIGSPRPVVEYGLIGGRPTIPAGFPRSVIPVDLRSVRIEPIKGVWCLRDNANILFNFGLNKQDADQALAVVRRYGFNRIGMVGSTVAPALTYFYAGAEQQGALPVTANALALAYQENALVRTGIPVPGVGYMGEMVKIEPRKVESRREGTEWVVVSGSEVLGRFGRDEAAARDAMRIIRDGYFTEFCRVGSHELTFFLVNGQAPTRIPLSAYGRRFDLNVLRTYSIGSRWAVTENGRFLFDVANKQEGDSLIKLLKYYRFDQVCRIGSSPRTGLTFLARTH